MVRRAIFDSIPDLQKMEFSFGQTQSSATGSLTSLALLFLQKRIATIFTYLMPAHGVRILQDPRRRDHTKSELAHRTLIVRKLKGLEDIIPFTSVSWEMLERGWLFVKPGEGDPDIEGLHPDPFHDDSTHIRDVYLKENPDYNGRFSVPVLYDKKQGKIVSNESSEIIRMFYHSFDHLLPDQYKGIELLPPSLKNQIEDTNKWTYDNINNGVYKTGFATTQEAYEKVVHELFTALDRVEAHLGSSAGPYYYGDTITEADIRLYTTIIRFDVVYVQHFKCNIRDIRSGYPAIHRWVRRLYWDVPAFHDTTVFPHIKKHYTRCHRQINPFGITPVGPLPDIFPKDEEVAAVAK